MLRGKRDANLTKREAELMDRIEELEDTLHIVTCALKTVHSGDNLSGGARMGLASMTRATLTKNYYGKADEYDKHYSVGRET